MTDLTSVVMNLKLLLGSAEASKAEDELLEFLVQEAHDVVLRRLYPFDDSQTEVSPRYNGSIAKIAVYLYNIRGVEGQTVHAENGIRREYESTDVPPSLLKDIIPFGKVI